MIFTLKFSNFISFENELFEDVPSEMKELISKMLTFDHMDRITPKELNEELK